MDLLIKDFPEAIVAKLKIKAINTKTTLKDLVIKILSQDVSKSKQSN